MLRLSCLFAMVLFCALNVFADGKSWSGYVQVGDRELYTVVDGGDAARAPLILLGGMSTRTQDWQEFVKELKSKDPGLPIVRFDGRGSGRTHARGGYKDELIRAEDVVTDLAQLLVALRARGIKGPYHFLGLSYGSAIGIGYTAAHKDQVLSFIDVAGYHSDIRSQREWILNQIKNVRKGVADYIDFWRQLQQAWGPLAPWLTFAQLSQIFPQLVASQINGVTDDQLYDYFVWLITFSSSASNEPTLLSLRPDVTYANLQAMFRKVQGVRKYPVAELIKQFPDGIYHFVQPERDQYISQAEMDDWWNLEVPKNVKGSRKIVDSEHKVPMAEPRLLASLVLPLVGKAESSVVGRSILGLSCQAAVLK